MPVADIAGNTPGATLFITAGLDGDEYVGIEAAYATAETYKDGDFCGRLIIVPIVNIPGFDAGTSSNPIDGKFPKYCIPGSLFGNTPRMMRKLVKTYARYATLWLDLHSGATGETVIPHMWNAITEIKKVDAVSTMFCQNSGADIIVREHATAGIKKLGKQGCPYVLAESDEVAQHTEYIVRAMEQLGMLPRKLPPPARPRIFQKSMAFTAANKHEVERMTGSIVLWQKIEPATTQDGRLGEIAYDEVKM
jgi:predicted deacylase